MNCNKEEFFHIIELALMFNNDNKNSIQDYA